MRNKLIAHPSPPEIDACSLRQLRYARILETMVNRLRIRPMKHRCSMPARTTLTAWVAAALLCLPAVANPAAANEPSEATSEEQSAEKHSNALRWSTATETDNFGYDVYRGESEDGPFKRLNPDPIPGAGTTDEPSSYEFIDDDIDPYKTYWYYLESISLSGVKERFTPIFRKKPKLTRETTEEASESTDDEQDQR